MERFGDRLKVIRLDRGLSQDELATLLGTSKQVISRYETSQRTPKITTANEFAETLNVPLAYLLGGDDDIFAYDNIIPFEAKKIPLLGSIAAGEPIFAEQDYESFVSCGNGIHADFALRVKGDSMINARIMDGDIVFIRKQPSVENGEIAAVIIEDEATLKRVFFYQESQKLVLFSENTQYEPFMFVGDELENVRILGKAIAFQSDVK